ncbi:MAG TPA: hypothetical protein VGM90_25180 [Kofleriaceae bacterium]
MTSVPPPNFGGGIGSEIRIADLIASVILFRVHEPASLTVGVFEGDQTFTPSDVYTLRYTAENADVLLEGRWVARDYAISYPNGERCGPTCHSAQLDAQPP